jgi:hypothetical protein
MVVNLRRMQYGHTPMYPTRNFFSCTPPRRRASAADHYKKVISTSYYSNRYYSNSYYSNPSKTCHFTGFYRRLQLIQNRCLYCKALDQEFIFASIIGRRFWIHWLQKNYKYQDTRQEPIQWIYSKTNLELPWSRLDEQHPCLGEHNIA